MATAVNHSKLVSLVKRGNSLPDAADALGLPVSVVGKHYYKAEVEADPKLKIPATPKAVKQARDKDNLRWERIAARTGMSVAAVKTAYEDAGGSLDDSWTGRGRKPGSNGSAKPAGRKTKTAAVGRKAKTASAGKSKTAGRGRKAKTAPRGRIRRRADRAAASGNPS